LELSRPEVFGGADMWVWQSPSVITGLTVIRVLYEIQAQDRRVLLWNISAVGIPDYGIL
jgi:hypothetical protein